MKTTLYMLAAVLAVAIAAGWVLGRHRTAKPLPVQEENSQSAPPEKESATLADTSDPLPPEQATAPHATRPEKSNAQTTSKPPRTSSPLANRPKREEIQDPMARLALGFVGADLDAEEYWIGAINDPSLSAHERQDLIEDLNEDGLSDPKHPGMQDLPLIVNRLQLIEQLAPFAMDQVNRDAFMEAYKDLTNMLEGRPIR
jgi:hypothetical protein